MYFNYAGEQTLHKLIFMWLTEADLLFVQEMPQADNTTSDHPVISTETSCGVNQNRSITSVDLQTRENLALYFHLSLLIIKWLSSTLSWLFSGLVCVCVCVFVVVGCWFSFFSVRYDLHGPSNSQAQQLTEQNIGLSPSMSCCLPFFPLQVVHLTRFPTHSSSVDCF